MNDTLTQAIDRKKVKAFLTELTALTHKYGIEIACEQLGFDATIVLDDHAELTSMSRYFVDGNLENLQLTIGPEPNESYHEWLIIADPPKPK